MCYEARADEFPQGAGALAAQNVRGGHQCGTGSAGTVIDGNPAVLLDLALQQILVDGDFGHYTAYIVWGKDLK